MNIRPYEDGDLVECRRLYVQLVEHHREIYDNPAIGGDDPGAGFDEYIQHAERAITWVADEDGSLLGLTGLLWRGEECEIEPVIVERSRRRQGVGRRLVETAIAEARRRGASDVNIRPVARNAVAIAAFHELGFRSLGHLEMFQRLDGTGEWRVGPEVHGRQFEL